MHKDDYSSADVTRITGVSRLRLHHWMKQGFFKPCGQVAGGHGTRNVYTYEDLYRIYLLKRLIESGIHGSLASRLIPESITIKPWWIYECIDEATKISIKFRVKVLMEGIEEACVWNNSKNGSDHV